MKVVSSLKVVDEVRVYKSVCVEDVSHQDFDILALGEDHKGERFDSVINWCEDNGKSVVRLKRTRGISSTDIKNRILEEG